MIGMQCWKVQEKSAVWAVEPSILATESRYRTESGVDFMGRIELDFPAGIWEPFATQRPPIRCSAGYLIYLQDTQATCFYYLKSGRVKSFMQSEDGAERILHTYEAGSLFGEASFFDGLPRVSSAVALTPCEIVPIDRELVIAEVSQNPDLALAMLKYLARTVRLLSSQVDDMAFRPVRRRCPLFSGWDCCCCLSQPGLGQPGAGPFGGKGLAETELWRGNASAHKRIAAFLSVKNRRLQNRRFVYVFTSRANSSAKRKISCSVLKGDTLARRVPVSSVPAVSWA